MTVGEQRFYEEGYKYFAKHQNRTTCTEVAKDLFVAQMGKTDLLYTDEDNLTALAKKCAKNAVICAKAFYEELKN